MAEEYKPIKIDVFIAGSGPIGCAFAREILDKTQNVKILMAEIGAQENPVIGAHHKNTVKYQKDIDAFVNVIKGALQPVSVPPAGTYIATLGGDGWTPVDPDAPGDVQQLISAAHNPKQAPEKNLPGCAITRTVGGMATHWTCACPEPHKNEYQNSPIKEELPALLADAKKLLNVNLNEYDISVRHNLVKAILAKKYGSNSVHNLPLAVKRNQNPQYVTWSGSNTVLGKYATEKDVRFDLRSEYKVIRLVRERPSGKIVAAEVRDMKTRQLYLVEAKKYIIACGSVGTPQILWNSGFGQRDDILIQPELPALGRYLTEQSIAFCQIVLKREYIKDIENSPLLSDDLKAKCAEHKRLYPKDPIHIPFNDPEPQVTMPGLTTDGNMEWHTQIHRDAFSYGDVGPRADPRLIVDLRFFGMQDIHARNRVKFEDSYTDTYGLPQATFEVTRSRADAKRDQRMMQAMCEAANELGSYLPVSYPQFMEPGLALHITGTTRIGTDDQTSVANANSQVHGHPNLYVGGNGVIPDSTACNPTLTSVAYAIKSARSIAKELEPNAS